MTVSRLYTTGKNLDVKNLSAKAGTERVYYRSKHVHNAICECTEGIAYKPLIFNMMGDFYKEVTLPLLANINEDYMGILKSIQSLKYSNYIKVNKEEPKVYEQDYYVKSVFLHRQLLKEGQIDKSVEINNEEYKVTSLSFGEMMENAAFNLIMAGEALVQPVTLGKLMQTTGYTESTIKKSIYALRYCGLLEKKLSEGKLRYSLRGDMEKISKFFERGKEKKMEKISRMKKYVEAKKLADKETNQSEISRQLNIEKHSIYSWLILDRKPKINDKVAQLLGKQDIISKEEIETFRNYGLIEQSALT